MKKQRFVLIILLLLILLPFLKAEALIIRQMEWNGVVCDYLAGEVVVGMKLNASPSVLDSLVARIGGEKRDSIPASKTYLIGFHPDTSITNVINHFKSSSWVRFAEPNLVGYPAVEQYQDSLWGFYNFGQRVDTLFGIPDADADILEARQIEKGDTTVMISIIDLGIAMNSVPPYELLHPDLNDENRIKLDTGLSPFTTRSSLREQSSSGHGTAVLGVAGAKENGSGIVGVADGCKFLVSEATLQTDVTSSFTLTQTIMHVIQLGIVDIISLSWEAPAPSDAMEDAVDSALNRGILIVGAAGNKLDTFVNSPALYAFSGNHTGNHPGHANGYGNVISVGGTYSNDVHYGRFSGISRKIGVVAPAVKIFTAHPNYLSPPLNFIYQTGTSFAAPLVAGIGGLLLSRYPTLQPDSVRKLIETTADKIWQDPLNTNAYDTPYIYNDWHPKRGYGRVNAFRAVTRKTLIAPLLDSAKVVRDAQDTTSWIKLFWTDNSVDEDNFWIYRTKFSTPYLFSKIASTAKNVLTYSDSRNNLKGSETYIYRVRTYEDTSRSGNFSDSAKVTNLPREPQLISATVNTNPSCGGQLGMESFGGIKPEAFAPPNCYNNLVTLSWQAPSPAIQDTSAISEYKIHARATPPSSPSDEWITVPGTVTKFTICLRVDKTYDLWVHTIDTHGAQSAGSNKLTRTTGHSGAIACQTYDPPRKVIIPDDPNNETQGTPSEFSISQNYPNPFNLSTQIRYSLPQDASVQIMIYNILGQKIKVLDLGYQTAGYKSVFWDGKDNSGNEVGSGIYFYRIVAGDFNLTKKMTLLK